MAEPRCYSKDPKIYLIRHGSTALNKEGNHEGTDRIRGWVEVPLNDVGRQDAERVAKELIKAKASPEGIFCSDLGRAVETAQIINKKFRVPLQPSMAFRPWHLGVYQGQESSKVAPDLAKLVKSPDKPVPQGEPFASFVQRFIPALQKLLSEVAQTHCDILVVTHFRNFKLADAWVKAGMKPDLSYDPKVILEDNAGTGEFTIIRPQASGRTGASQTTDTSPPSGGDRVQNQR